MFGRPSRRMWIAAIVVSVLCVSGLVYALATEWNTPPARHTEPTLRQASGGGSGFGFGLVIGVGAGVVLGSLIALRKKG